MIHYRRYSSHHHVCVFPVCPVAWLYHCPNMYNKYRAANLDAYGPKVVSRTQI